MIDFLVNFDKYPEVIATVITLIVFAVIRYFLDSIIEKFLFRIIYYYKKE